MIGVAAVLIVLVLIFAIAVVVSNAGRPSVNPEGFLEFSIFGAHIDATLPGIFFTGAATMLVLLLALWLLFVGLRRARGQHKRIKTLKKSAAAIDKEKSGSAASDTASSGTSSAGTGSTGAMSSATSGSTERTSPSAGRPTTSEPTGSSTTAGSHRSSSQPETTPEDRSSLLDEVERATGPDESSGRRR